MLQILQCIYDPGEAIEQNNASENVGGALYNSF